ncbi:MAG: CRTAC1 family protein, partial [Acidobacteria bacterium]|nr:CRTAC1 family protein [Acidobacteriota bacterium]
EGRPRSGMGVDAADYDQDGWTDLFVANIDHEIYSLYHNNHDETFDDLANQSGVAQATRLMSGWGLKFFDYDNDGNLDLFLANGNPDDLIESLHPGVGYHEPSLLFHNSGRAFENVSSQSGPFFQKPLSARGLAIGDFDNDGGVDVLVAVNDDNPILLRNQVGRQNHWLGLYLRGRKSNPDAVGARISYQAGDLKRSRMKVGGGSYLSAHDPRMVLGLGQREKVDILEVKWPQPSGLVQRFTNVPVDRYISLVEGEVKWK